MNEMNVKNERRVAVTGMGVVSPFGAGKDIYWYNIREGNSAASLIRSFDVTDLPTKFYARVPMDDTELEDMIEDKKSAKTMSRAAKMAMIASEDAVKESGIDTASLDPYRFGTSMGAAGIGLWDIEYSNRFLELIMNTVTKDTGKEQAFSNVWQNIMENLHPLTPLKALPNITTAHIAIKNNARGNCQTISTACTSSAQAIGEAYRQIKGGYADVMITGGSDSMANPNGIVAFSMLGVLSKNNTGYLTAAKPFDKRRDGFMIGEGSAVFILEEYESAKKRGADIYCEIIGYASTNDAFRLTDEPPDARGSIMAMEIALNNAGIDRRTVDYINSHGTGTQMNDRSETFAIKSVFGKDAYSIPISSTKSMIGHLIAGAGCIELAACILAMKNQIIPPTINYEVPDGVCDLDYVPNFSRDAKLNIIQSNSFGFGGQNACLIIKKV